MSCPSVNTPSEGENCFFCSDGIHWDAHRIGWAVAGGCAALTTLITFFTVTMHATHYQHPAAQRQVIRVLLMPPVYAIVSFFSYRYYREYEYYILAETAYEAVTLSAFLMLLMELVATSTVDKNIMSVLKEKDKKKLPFPFNFIRFRASKPYFMHALSFSVLQYVVIRPVISIVGIICEYYSVLCPNKYSVHFAEVYIEAVDFVSISFALYGLIVFYFLCKDELKGRRPLNKFLAIKLIVFFTFYQSFVFSVLQNYNVIKATSFWTADNVSDGLSALCTTVEMVVFSLYMGWAYSWTEYTNPAINPDQRKTGFKTYLQAIWDTINMSDFLIEIWLAVRFLIAYLRGVEGTHSTPTKMQKTFMPHTINPQEKLPLSTMDTESQRGIPPRRTSGNLMVNGQAPYQRLDPSSEREREREQTGGNTNSNGSAAFPNPQPTGYSSNPARSPQSAYTSSPPFSASQSSQYQYNPSPASFPSPHPAGAYPPPSADSTQSYNTTNSGNSHYATPTAWNGNEQSSWPGTQRDNSGYDMRETGRPVGQAGIPGNPRLY